MKTTAEIRRENIGKLAKRCDRYAEDTYEVIREATKAMNAFYRYAGFAVNKFYFENDGNRYNEKVAERLDKKDDKWFRRINEYLAPFKVKATFNGVYPSIIDATVDYYSDLYLTSWY